MHFEQTSNEEILRARILKLFWNWKKLKVQWIKLKRGHEIFYFQVTKSRKKAARASRSHIKVVLEGEEVKINISGDKFKKSALNALFFLCH